MSIIAGGLAGAFANAERMGHQRHLEDDEMANRKRDSAIQRAALLAGLMQQGITSDASGDAQPLGDTGMFRHPGMIAPDNQYMATPEGVVKIDKRAGTGDVMRDASGNPVGGAPAKESLVFDQNGRPSVVNTDHPQLPSDFVGKHDTPKVKSAGVVNPATKQIEDVYDDGTRKVIRPATDAEVTKATRVPPDPNGVQFLVSQDAAGNPVYAVGDKNARTITPTDTRAKGSAAQTKVTTQQAKERTYVSLMAQSIPTMEQLSDKVRPERIAFAVSHPAIGNVGLNQDEQLYLQAARNFLAGVLHQESGARLSNEQWNIGVQRFFPTVGDTPITKRAKLDQAKRVLSDRSGALQGGQTPTATPGTPPPASSPFGDLIPKKPEDELE